MNEVEYRFLHVRTNTSQKKSQGAIYPKGYEAKTPSAKKKSRVTTRKLTFLQYYFCNLCQRTPSLLEKATLVPAR